MSEARVVVSAVLLAAGVAAVVAAGMTRMAADERPRIASVRLSSLTAGYVTRSLREGGDSKKALDAAREWAGRLEKALTRVAAQRGAVLFTSGAVAAGAEDLTREVEAAMAALASRKGSTKKEENTK